MSWCDDLKVGDTIEYLINVNYRLTGEKKRFILTDELLDNIKKYEDDKNYHHMVVVN